jgi:hypothetical protein
VQLLLVARTPQSVLASAAPSPALKVRQLLLQQQALERQLPSPARPGHVLMLLPKLQ